MLEGISRPIISKIGRDVELFRKLRVTYFFVERRDMLAFIKTVLLMLNYLQGLSYIAYLRNTHLAKNEEAGDRLLWLRSSLPSQLVNNISTCLSLRFVSLIINDSRFLYVVVGHEHCPSHLSDRPCGSLLVVSSAVIAEFDLRKPYAMTELQVGGS